jgi:hypothetical protein
VRIELEPGKHTVRARVHGLLMSAPFRSLDLTVEPGQITEVTFSLTMMALVNPGKLRVKGTRPG